MAHRDADLPRLVCAAGLFGVSLGLCCAGASPAPDCHLGVAEGHQYCFFTRRSFDSPRRAMAAGRCPNGYDAARVEVPNGTVCLAEQGTTVPPEICTDLPEGCVAPADRRLVTPTDERRDALVRRHGMRYARCLDSRGARLEPFENRLSDEIMRSHERELRALYSNARIDTIWQTGLNQCCTAASAPSGGLCLWLRVHAQTPAELDATLARIAKVPPGEAQGRPGIEISDAPPEP